MRYSRFGDDIGEPAPAFDEGLERHIAAELPAELPAGLHGLNDIEMRGSGVVLRTVTFWVPADDYDLIRRHSSRTGDAMGRIVLRWIEPRLLTLDRGGSPRIVPVEPVGPASGVPIGFRIEAQRRQRLTAYSSRRNVSAARMLLGWCRHGLNDLRQLTGG